MIDSSHHADDRANDDGVEVLSGSHVTMDVLHHNGAVILRVTGEIDLLTAPRVDEAMTFLLRQQPSVLVMDLSGVTFLASAGLKLLVAAHEASGGGTHVRVVANDQRTIRPIELTGLTEYIAVYATVAEALDAD